MKLLVLNGPNINLLGTREPQMYGKKTYQDLIDSIKKYCNEKNHQVEFYQSNHEGDLVDKIQETYKKHDAIVFNPAAYTHTSIALLDALLAVGTPCVEVHISDINQREAFRQHSFIREACITTISGQGLSGYIEAIKILEKEIKV